MRDSPVKFIACLLISSFMLAGCQSSVLHTPTNKIPRGYVETENINWDYDTEKNQELADEI